MKKTHQQVILSKQLKRAGLGKKGIRKFASEAEYNEKRNEFITNWNKIHNIK